VTNSLTLGSTSANPFTISVSGAATGFSNSSNYNWNILSLGSGSISGFNASNFTVSDYIVSVARSTPLFFEGLV